MVESRRVYASLVAPAASAARTVGLVHRLLSQLPLVLRDTNKKNTVPIFVIACYKYKLHLQPSRITD